MTDLVRNPEDWFSHDAAHIDKIQGFVKHLINFSKKVKKFNHTDAQKNAGECRGSVVQHQTQEREVGGSKPTSAVLCP